MAPEFFLQTALRGAMRLLPVAMDTPPARAMILAICLQESALQFRKQVGGPAKGYAQFEQSGGVVGVLTHPQVAAYTKVVCAALDVPPTAIAVYTSLEQNDVLAAALARLLLWTLPDLLPQRDEAERGWQQYMAAWRPGRPRRESWNANYEFAWSLVEDEITKESRNAELDKIGQLAVNYIEAMKILSIEADALLAKKTNNSK